MICEKIRAVRENTELTSKQVASLIKTNVYLYRKYESGSIAVSTDALVFLSAAYKIPTAWFLMDEISIQDILDEPAVLHLRNVPEKDRTDVLRRNICEKCSFACQAINRYVLSDIRNAAISVLSANLIRLRTEKGAAIAEVADVLSLKDDAYCSFEKGVTFPTPGHILALAAYYDVSVADLIEKAV